MLNQHGESDLADRALSLTDDELARIETLGASCALSEEEALELGDSRALSLASIDVPQSTGRDLRLSRADWERQEDLFDGLAKHDVVLDRELRRHAIERQIPADESKWTLDTANFPAWGAGSAGCHPAASPLSRSRRSARQLGWDRAGEFAAKHSRDAPRQPMRSGCRDQLKISQGLYA